MYEDSPLHAAILAAGYSFDKELTYKKDIGDIRLTSQQTSFNGALAVSLHLWPNTVKSVSSTHIRAGIGREWPITTAAEFLAVEKDLLALYAHVHKFNNKEVA